MTIFGAFAACGFVIGLLAGLIGGFIAGAAVSKWADK